VTHNGKEASCFGEKEGWLGTASVGTQGKLKRKDPERELSVIGKGSAASQKTWTKYSPIGEGHGAQNTAK